MKSNQTLQKHCVSFGLQTEITVNHCKGTSFQQVRIHPIEPRRRFFPSYKYSPSHSPRTLAKDLSVSTCVENGSLLAHSFLSFSLFCFAPRPLCFLGYAVRWYGCAQHQCRQANKIAINTNQGRPSCGRRCMEMLLPTNSRARSRFLAGINDPSARDTLHPIARTCAHQTIIS